MNNLLKLFSEAADLIGLNLQAFDNTNVTGDTGMSAEMKTFSTYKDLI